jgi:hypothetical protein
MHYEILTETQIENRVESAIDRLDRHLLSNQITQEQYDRDIVSIDKWASQQYDHLKNAKGMLWSVTW